MYIQFEIERRMQDFSVYAWFTDATLRNMTYKYSARLDKKPMSYLLLFPLRTV